VKIERHAADGPQGRRSPSRRRPWPLLLLLPLVLTTIGAGLLWAARNFPLETLVMAVALTVSGICIVLYMGELVVLGWVVDFLSEIGMPKIKPTLIPLEYEDLGEIIVVRLRDNVATVGQCQLVWKQFQRLIDEHHCNFVLDFSAVGKVSRSLRKVMVQFMTAARKEAEKLGKPYRPLAAPRGERFIVFDNRKRAVEEMSAHAGHGWVVLCSVPAGVRAVSAGLV
jgi:hypothetical protein